MPLENETPEAPETNGSVDVDALLEKIESPNGDERGSDDVIEGQVGIDAKQEQKPQAPQPIVEYEINWNGKKIKAPVDKILQWASQGYDYPQKMEILKRQQAEFSTERKRWEDVQNKYKPVEEYIQKDPSWWDHVQKSFQSKNLGVEADAPYSAALRSIQEKLQKYDEFIDKQSQAERSATIEKEDKAVSEEIDSIRKQYPDLDFDSPDESGKPLLLKVLEHGISNDIRNFKTAFRDYAHDILIKRAEGKAKEGAAKETQKRAKLGLVGESQTPRTKQLSKAEDIKNKSYDDLLNEVKQEYGIG